MKKLLLLILIPHLTLAQPQFIKLNQFCDSLVQAGMKEKLVPGLGLVMIKGDSSFSATYGFANVEKSIPADTTTLFQLGSVGKVFTVIAVLQQVEKGKLDLYSDVNTYLEGFATAPPGRPITLFDLLTHTAGLDDRVIGYLARSEEDVKPLGEHLREYLPPSFQSPGKEINYSNYGYALAGHIVERVSGKEFRQYVTENIFQPLGMIRTTYALPDNYEELLQYAHGYRIRDTYENVTCYPRHATPAGSALSCLADMKKLVQELLRPSGKLLSSTSMNKLFKRQFSSHDLLMGYTLGMEEQIINGHRGVAKGGAFTGFLSELVLFPEQQVGLFITTNTQTDNFLELFRTKVFERIFPQPNYVASFPEIKIDLAEFAGVYRSERYNHRSIEDLLALYQGKLELSVSKDGDLTTYQNGSWQHYRPIDSLIFQNTRAPEQRLVFVRDIEGRISRLYTNVNLAGFYLPVSLTPVAWYDDPVMINEYYFIVLVIILTFIFVPLFRGWVMWRRKSNSEYFSNGLVPMMYLYPVFAVLIFYTIQFFGGFLYLARHINDFYFGVPESWTKVQLTTYVLPFVVLLLVIAAIRIWLNQEGRWPFRIYYSLIAVCAVVHLAFLWRWHFIGIHV
ncbi:MAG: beta-lactamase family protein [Cyclobacteriaceae bacterium]|nr:beta-lactamase family protein [Cyclobacteriaceae bacterium]